MTKNFVTDLFLINEIQTLKKELFQSLSPLSNQEAKKHLENKIADLFSEKISYYQKHMKLTILRSVYHDIEKRKPRYNAMFNRKDMVLFETALAGAIYKQKAFLASGLWLVADKIAFILENTLLNDEVMLSTPQLKSIREIYFKEIFTWDCRDEFNKQRGLPIETPIQLSEIPIFKEWALRILRSQSVDHIIAQIFVIYTYIGFITRPDRMCLASIEEAPVELFLSHAQKELIIKNYIRHKMSKKSGLFIQQEDLPYLNKKNNLMQLGRSGARKEKLSQFFKPLNNSVSDNPPQNIAGIVPGKGCRGSEPIALDELPADFVALLLAADLDFRRTSAGVWQPCLPEPDRNRRQLNIPLAKDHFYNEAIRKNLPLVGGASGGVGTFEIAALLVDNLPQTELEKFRLLVTAIYISKGFHSIHEMASIINLMRDPKESLYQPGNYGSFIQQGLIAKKDLDTLHHTFPYLLKEEDVEKGMAEEMGFPTL